MADTVGPALNKAHNSVSLTAYKAAEEQQRGFDRALKENVERLDRAAVEQSENRGSEVGAQREAAKARRVAQPGANDASNGSGHDHSNGSDARSRGRSLDVQA